MWDDLWMAYSESVKEQDRRGWVIRQEEFKDTSEAHEAALAAAVTEDDRRRLKQEFSEYRRAYREEGVRRGNRLSGTHVATHQIMWARWIEVAVEQEIIARKAFRELLAGAENDAIMREFRASLVSVTSSAYSIEALYGEIKYLLPAPTSRPDKRHLMLSGAFRKAFGATASEHSKLQRDLAWLFDLRDQAAHPYTEIQPVQPHPAGINTSAEASKFNAVTSGKAVDIALTVLRYADPPKLPCNSWVERWSKERGTHHRMVDALRANRRREPLLLTP